MGFREPAWRVTVSGRDVSSKMAPVLESISVTDKDGVQSDSCEIVLADVDGSVLMPEKDDPISIELGHQGLGVGLVFSGFVDSTTSSGAHGSGRKLTIKGKSARPKSQAKQPQERHLDDKTFGEAAKKFGEKAGLQVKVAGKLASLKRKYWSMQNESFLHWGQRMSRELGATFKVNGENASFLERNGGESAGGSALATVRAVWGENLLSWSISPDRGRPQFNKVKTRWYDPKSAKWKTEEREVEADAQSERTSRFQQADKDTAKQNADGDGKASERHKGSGSVHILGDASAKPEGKLILIGARPGIDGDYDIETITHKMTKPGGYTCEISVGKPKAKKDGRGKK